MSKPAPSKAPTTIPVTADSSRPPAWKRNIDNQSSFWETVGNAPSQLVIHWKVSFIGRCFSISRLRQVCLPFPERFLGSPAFFANTKLRSICKNTGWKKHCDKTVSAVGIRPAQEGSEGNWKLKFQAHPHSFKFIVTEDKRTDLGTDPALLTSADGQGHFRCWEVRWKLHWVHVLCLEVLAPEP